MEATQLDVAGESAMAEDFVVEGVLELFFVEEGVAVADSVGVGVEPESADGVLVGLALAALLRALGSATVAPSKNAFRPLSTPPQHATAPFGRAPQKPYATYATYTKTPLGGEPVEAPQQKRVQSACRPHAPGGLAWFTATRRSLGAGATSAYQPQGEAVPSKASTTLTLSPCVTNTPAAGAVPWLSPQHDTPPAVLTAQVDTYWGNTFAHGPALGTLHCPQ